MEPDADIVLGYYRGPVEPVLRGLDAAGLEGSVVELHATSDALRSFVDERAKGHPELVEHNARAWHPGIGIGPFRLRLGTHPEPRVPIEPGTFTELIAMTENNEDPLFIWELQVLDAEGSLVEAPDLGDNEIFVSSRVPERSRQALITALGDGFEPWPD